VFFTDVVMPSLIDNIPSRSHEKTLKRWLIHVDNARPHKLRLSQKCNRAFKAEWLARPVYNPEVAPSDFFLLGDIKDKHLTRIARASQTS
jgi:hypothetical protein